MSRLSGLQKALLALLAGLAFLPAVRTGFLYDDHSLIETNPSLRSWSLATLKHDFTSGVFGPDETINFYRPMQIMSTRIEYSLFKLNPLPYHITNLLLHIGNTVLLAILLLALGFEKRTSLLASCLFGAHPIIVESMLMVSGRGELLGMFFTLCSLIMWLQKDFIVNLAGYATFILALLSKESAVITPVFFALVLYAQNDLPSRYKSIIPMSVIAVLYFMWRSHVLGHLLLPIGAKQTAMFGLMEFPKVLVTYARILIAPWDLHTDRLLPRGGIAWYVYTLGVLGFSAWVIWSRVRWAIFSLLWFIVAILPKAVVMIAGSFMSDHWAYAALPTIVLPISVGLNHLWGSAKSPYRMLARCLFALFLLGEWALVTFNITQRNTDEKLYRQALRYTTSWAMTYNLGVELLRQHRTTEAIPYLEEIQHRDPSDPAANHALAYGYWTSGQQQRAIALLDTLHRQVPGDASTLQLLNELKHASTAP